MKFKHSAVVKITDTKKMVEVIKFLESIGYKFYFKSDEYMYIRTYTVGGYAMLKRIRPDIKSINCGEDIEMFKAIVAINDDNVYSICDGFKKATPEQLTKHFKNDDV